MGSIAVILGFVITLLLFLNQFSFLHCIQGDIRIMDERNLNALYLQIRGFSQQFTCDFIDGVATDINEFFRMEEKIKEFTLTFDVDTNHYMVVAKIEELDIANTRGIFLDFIRFLSYPVANIQACEEAISSIHYILLSIGKFASFYCEITFIS
jgi:hypothetical protein